MRTLLVLALALAAELARADTGCAEWNLAGSRSIDQGNGFHLELSLKQDGETLSGTAWYGEITRNAEETYETNRDAGVGGHIDGAKVDFEVQWTGGQVGVYSGGIDAQGRLSGSTYDRAHPGKHIAWHSAEPVSCMPIPAKPIHRLGKVPAKPPMMTSSDVLRAKTTGGDVTDRDAAAKARCRSGFVPRLARADDLVCVTMESFDAVRIENRVPEALWFKGGAYGDRTCLAGYVWREAFAGDKVCVKPQRRDDVAEENRLAASRRQ
jgi:hypothetical protein